MIHLLTIRIAIKTSASTAQEGGDAQNVFRGSLWFIPHISTDIEL